MPIVYDLNGGAQEVPDETAVRLVGSGQYTLEPGSRVTVRNSLGGKTSVDSRLLDSQPESLSPYSAVDEASDLRQQRLEREHDTIGSKAKATVGGAADALSLGFISPWEDDREFHPYYSGAGAVGGLAATLLIPGAGEANAARIAGEGAATGARTAGLLGRAGRAIGAVAERTPLGLATRLGSEAGSLVRGGRELGVLGRIGATAVEGGTTGGAIGLGTELSHQLLDSDAEFSGEQLLGHTLTGIGLGAGIGALGSATSEGASALWNRIRSGGSKAARASEEAMARESVTQRIEADTQRASSRTPRPYDEALDTTPGGRPPLAPMLDPRNASLIDGVTSRTRDLERLSGQLEALSEAPVLAAQAGLSKAYVRDALGTVQRELNGLRSLSRYEDAPLARIAEDAHANDLVGYRLAQSSERVPARWSDPEVRTQSLIARDKALDALAAKRAQGLPVSQAEEDAVRYSIQLGSPRPEAIPDIRGSLLGRAARSLIERLPGGRILSQGLGAGAGVGIAEHVISNGMGALVGKAVLPTVAGGLAAKAIQVAFRDPHVGGIIAANTSRLLNSTARLRDGGRPQSNDPRVSLRELGDRARRITPQQVMASTVASMSGVAGSSPLAASAAGQAAARRHAELLALLDRLDPQASTQAQLLMGRPLPTALAARNAADFIRMASSPTAFVVAAAQGRLTPAMMSAAERLWPASVRRARAELSSLLSDPTAASRMTPLQRRNAEAIMGSSLGPGTRSVAYASAMSESAQRSMATPPSGQAPRAGTVRTAPPAPTPADRASNPGAYR